jgi:hypothetical protein
MEVNQEEDPQELRENPSHELPPFENTVKSRNGRRGTPIWKNPESLGTDLTKKSEKRRCQKRRPKANNNP